MATVEDRLAKLEEAVFGSSQRPMPRYTGPNIADDSDLDSKFGRPEVKFHPKRWDGPSQKGLHFNECEPDFLEMLADTLEYFAKKDDEQGLTDKNGGPKSKWNRLDAARARGWARRIRASRAAPQVAPPARQAPAQLDFADHLGYDDGNDQLPFL